MNLSHSLMAMWSSWSGLFAGLPNGDLIAALSLALSFYAAGHLIKKVFGQA
jgi:hypothetical protein